MQETVPKESQNPDNRTRESVRFDGRDYPMYFEQGGWRVKSRAKTHRADFRTGTQFLNIAKQRAKKILGSTVKRDSRKGGGTLEAIVRAYLEYSYRRTTKDTANGNVSSLRTICRKALGKELSDVTCREVGPELWEKFQRVALEMAGREFSMVTRYRENVSINSRVRQAKTIFLPEMKRYYQSLGFSIRDDVAAGSNLRQPYIILDEVDGEKLVAEWRKLRETDLALWLIIGIARFAGLRKKEIKFARAGWVKNGCFVICDRPHENFFHKTGKKPYQPQIIDPELAQWLADFAASNPPETFIVRPEKADSRDYYFKFAPIRWLRSIGIDVRKPLHRLRGLHADAVLELTRDAVMARMEGLRAAQQALGHTSPRTTEGYTTK